MEYTEWNIRTLLNTVITRLLIYGINAIDLEKILSVIEQTTLFNTRFLEKKWLELWENKANRYISYAQSGEKQDNFDTACELYLLAAQCYFAGYLINFSSIDDKRKVYQKFSELYYKASRYFNSIVEKIDIPIDQSLSIAAYLHLPVDINFLNGCVVFYSGLGSCKEEMHVTAQAIARRGIAVLVPDMPGNGETLFEKKIKCRMANMITG